MFNALDQHIDISTREEMDLHHGVLIMRNIDTLVGVAQLDIQVESQVPAKKPLSPSLSGRRTCTICSSIPGNGDALIGNVPTILGAQVRDGGRDVLRHTHESER